MFSPHLIVGSKWKFATSPSNLLSSTILTATKWDCENSFVYQNSTTENEAKRGARTSKVQAELGRPCCPPQNQLQIFESVLQLRS